MSERGKGVASEPLDLRARDGIGYLGPRSFVCLFTRSIGSRAEGMRKRRGVFFFRGINENIIEFKLRWLVLTRSRHE